MRIVVFSVFSLLYLGSSAWAVEPQSTTPPATGQQLATVHTIPANKPGVIPSASQNTAHIPDQKLTAEQLAKNKILQEAKVKALVKDQESRLQQLEKANLEALSQNQELQLKNDNLGVQVQVLQSERSAQMFLYGAVTIAIGVLLGFLIASYVYGKRRRQW
ncbi:hypothetical protein B9T31_13845 [Acinetobacter sp. ANC 4558]|uniref:hypothetical protein n=1 Tax=Acinetobacter sp. ANC 4558 TaxID=1977876 RepID=UPI000A34576E|nr:hypothetical protein [Acinetobacter sp. ANC 4558]OTG83168.1 hypothetical protein B9T31_13845 [Acinetobacter sp. ANC 4558]